MLRRQIIEDSAKDHLRQKQLITTADLASDPALLFDNVLVRREAQTTKNAFAVPQFVEMHDRMRALDLLLRRAHLHLQFLLLRVLTIQRRKVRVGVKGVRDEAGLEDLDLLLRRRQTRQQVDKGAEDGKRAKRARKSEEKGRKGGKWREGGGKGRGSDGVARR